MLMVMNTTFRLFHRSKLWSRRGQAMPSARRLMRGMQLGLPVGYVLDGLALWQRLTCWRIFGPTNHSYTKHEFVTRYRENFDDAGALDVLLD